MKPIYTLKMKVRDYECDIQGIVNNANYQHYLEHTRHEFLIENGMSFAQLHERGIELVVARVEIAYKNSLRPGDEFFSSLDLKQEGLKYVFFQEIRNGEKLCIRAKIDCVAAVNGRLARVKEIDDFVEQIHLKFQK